MSVLDLLAADIATLRQYALVFGNDLAVALRSKWQQYGATNCVPYPVALLDGRQMLLADVLSEVHPGGLLHSMWAASDHAQIAAGVEVLPLAEALTLLPPETAL